MIIESRSFNREDYRSSESLSKPICANKDVFAPVETTFGMAESSLSLDFCQYVRTKLLNDSFLNLEHLKNLSLSEDELVFAQSLPLIGAGNLYSQQIMSGIKACFMAINDAGGIFGKKLRLLSINDYQDPLITYKNIKYLFRKHNLNVYMGNLGESGLLSILPMIKDEQVMVLFPYANNRSFLTPYLRNIVNGGNNRELQIDRILEFAIHKVRARRIAIFHPEDEVGVFQAQYASMWLTRMLVKPIAVASYNPENVLIESAANRLIEKSPDCVICLGSYMPNSRLISRFLKKRMMHTIFVGTEDMFFTAKILEGLPAKIFYCSYVPNPEASGYKVVREYLLNLQKYYPEEKPSPLGLNYYINAKIITNVLISLGAPVSQNDLLTVLRHGVENLRLQDIGGMIVDFNYHDRCAYPLDPRILNLKET